MGIQELEDYFSLIKRFFALPISSTQSQVKVCPNSTWSVLRVSINTLTWEMMQKLQIGHSLSFSTVLLLIHYFITFVAFQSGVKITSDILNKSVELPQLLFNSCPRGVFPIYPRAQTGNCFQDLYLFLNPLAFFYFMFSSNTWRSVDPIKLVI